MKKVPVIITNGWLRIAYNIVESLARHGIPVHVVDASSLAMCRVSRWTSSFHRVPSHYENPHGFVLAIADIATRIGAKVLIPVHEEVLPLANNRHLLPPDLCMALTSADKIKTCLSKWDTIKLCEQIDVPVPKSHIPNSFDELSEIANRVSYPAVIKTRIGNSAKGVVIVYNQNHLLESYKSLLQRFNIKRDQWPIIQEYLGEDIHGVCMIYEHGKLRSAFCEKYIRCKNEGKFGTSTYRISTHNPQHIELCKRVADSLEWHGVIHFDLLVDPKTGMAKIIEINPRFWGALNLSIISGVDFPLMQYELTLTGSIKNPPKSYQVGISSRWAAGDIIAFINAITGKSNLKTKLKLITEILGTPMWSSYDDIRLSDITPFLLEIFDYIIRYLTLGSANPVEEGMVR